MTPICFHRRSQAGSWRWIILATWVATTLLLCGLILGAEQGSGGGGVSVRLGQDVTGPGQESSLLLALSLAGDLEINQLRGELSFPKAMLSFIEVEPASGRSEAGTVLQISARLLEETKEKDGVELSVISLNVSTDSVFPAGGLVKVVFKVSPGVLKGSSSTIEVRWSGSGVTPEGREVKAPESELGMITVMEIPAMPDLVPACFFYMH